MLYEMIDTWYVAAINNVFILILKHFNQKKKLYVIKNINKNVKYRFYPRNFSQFELITPVITPVITTWLLIKK